MIVYFVWSACVLYFYAPAWPFYSFETERGHILRSHIPLATARTRPIIKRMSFLWSFYDINSSNLLSEPVLTQYSHFSKLQYPENTRRNFHSSNAFSRTHQDLLLKSADLDEFWRQRHAHSKLHILSIYLHQQRAENVTPPQVIFHIPPFSGK